MNDPHAIFIVSPRMDKIGFGGGCHWCTEAVFDHLIGITKVEQGYIRSTPPQDTFSEAVIVNFDQETVGLSALVEIHLRTHACTSDHSMRGKYRSAVYVFNDIQTKLVENTISQLQCEFDDPIITQIIPFCEFKKSDECFTNYYVTDPSRPFCTTYIDPKLKLLRERYSKVFREKSARTEGPN